MATKPTSRKMMTKAASPGIYKNKGLATKRKPGYDKIERCCARARAYDIEYVWIDTCCIDKTSSAERSEAIKSMYGWYEGARICYAWLCDVPTADSVILPIDPRAV
ncbi:heterokaryon incompatibility protein-domain-containing protein [Rhypophila decipiens]|uniref:Heterokaryon incompatibility protein-domain-containing protein n=1 Tax=Rhypophila decipiens TaxID=261697 RepID=A0AAN6Y7M5_9PEZI|nr:heterokaryon incompatibility protein-domain-containing protein [Rhypophila decipiens]